MLLEKQAFLKRTLSLELRKEYVKFRNLISESANP
jgi:hypothetical protein